MTNESAVAADREALAAFYESTGGPNWNDNSNWLSARPLNEWFGVKVDDTGRVEHLTLRGNQLSGNIPPAIGNLTNMKTLDLRVNWLTGCIPTELCELTHLNSLILTGNRLTGNIPAKIVHLLSLRTLHLDYNLLCGSIPIEIGQMKQLSLLSLSNNNLTGRIPIEIGQMKQLSFLDLADNKLSGGIPAEFGNLTGLSFLCLNQNELTGRIPAEIGNLSKLSILGLADNQLTGSIPLELSNLTTMFESSFLGNPLTGRAWPWFTGQLRRNVARMVTFRVVQVDGLDGALPPWLDFWHLPPNWQLPDPATLMWTNQTSLVKALRQAAIAAFDTAKQDAFSGNVSLMLRVHLKNMTHRRRRPGPAFFADFLFGVRDVLVSAPDKILRSPAVRAEMDAFGLQPSRAIAFHDGRQVIQTVSEMLEGDRDWYEVIVAEVSP